MVKIKLLTYKHVFGLADLQVETGKVTKITGENAAGKSSAIKGLLSMIEGGHEASLIRAGESFADVVMVVESDGDEYKFRKHVTPSGSTLEALKNGEPQGKEQTLLNSLISKLGANPVTFLRGKQDEQLKWLLAATPLAVTREQLSQAIGAPFDGPVDGHALVVIDSLRNKIYEQRTGVNRSLTDARKTAQRLKDGLAPDAGEDLVALSNKKQADLTFLKLESERRAAAISTAKTQAKEELQARFDKYKTVNYEELALKIEQLRLEYAAKLETARKQLDGLVQKTENEADAARAALHEELDPKIAALTGEISGLKVRAEEQVRSKANREHYDETVTQGKALALEAEGLTGSIENLDALKSQLLTKMPIPGLEVKDGKIYFNGVILDQVNTAEQMKLAIKIAALKSKPGDPIIVDGLECFDAKNMAAFERIAEKSPYQFIFTCVGNGPLKVESLA